MKLTGQFWFWYGYWTQMFRLWRGNLFAWWLKASDEFWCRAMERQLPPGWRVQRRHECGASLERTTNDPNGERT